MLHACRDGCGMEGRKCVDFKPEQDPNCINSIALGIFVTSSCYYQWITHALPSSVHFFADFKISSRYMYKRAGLND